MNNMPDWVWAVNPHGSPNQPFEVEPWEIPDPGVFYLDDAVLPIHNWWARHGVKGTLQKVTPEGDVSAFIRLRRGPLGWWMRRWLRTHPLKLTVQMYRPEWGEWREQVGTVHVEN